ncbi:MAG TPA: M2 family metallopeptidase [Ignavibacteriaceae bacterium]|nr:M2 family metallopeptidase [Ignavibacteriaceae bacterium]
MELILKSKNRLKLVIALFFSVIIVGCNPGKEEMKQELTKFIENYESKVVELAKNANIAYFDATISGKDEDYKKAADLQVELSKIFANKEDFAKLKKIKESNLITDEIQKRQLEKLYLAYQGNQIDEEKLEAIIKLQTEIEQKYSTFRAEVDGKKLSDNQVEEVLKNSTNSVELEKTWLAHKAIGNVVVDDVLKLVKMRNEIASELGFKNYHQMSLKLSEQDPDEIEKLFDELDKLTSPTFVQLKSDIDNHLSTRLNLPKENLMPWHYQNRFFQEAPKIYTVDLDSYYKDKDLVKITEDYYAGIDLPIDDLIKKSDLFEKEGKYQHAYCTDIDRAGDVRVVCNVKPNYNWMNTMLHEYGHAVYDKFMDLSLPWTLREPAHTFTTEAIAMMFGRLASNPKWMKDVLGISDEEMNKIAEDNFKSLRLEQLIFSRWVQVVYRFEKSMYENPDQDLNKLWWDLVEKYQMLKRPEGRNQPDWVTKIHIALYPAYYHNYMLGELLASQFHSYITANILKSDDLKNQSYASNKEVGKYLNDKVFQVAAKNYWNDMIEKSTGEKLTAKYYAKQFVE